MRSPFFVGDASAHAREIILLDLVRVELCGAIAHLREDLLGGRQLSLNPAERIDARDDERAKIRTDEPLLLQSSDRSRDLLFDLEREDGEVLVMFDRLADALVGERLDAAKHRMIRTAGEAGVFLVTDAERHEGRVLEVER